MKRLKPTALHVQPCGQCSFVASARHADRLSVMATEHKALAHPPQAEPAREAR